LSQQPFDGRRFVAAVGGRDGGAQRRLFTPGFRLQGVEGDEGDGRGGGNVHGSSGKKNKDETRSAHVGSSKTRRTVWQRSGASGNADT
jgi:hypothetical protein